MDVICVKGMNQGSEETVPVKQGIKLSQFAMSLSIQFE